MDSLMPPRPAVLYISYDGILEPLGESQVVSYLERLGADFAITVLTFEKPDDLADQARITAMRRRLAAADVEWAPRRYHKAPPVLSTAFDVAGGIARGRAIARARGVRIVHARGYVPSLIALGVRAVGGAAFLFDMRGFWVDEKVEAGHWRRGGILHRVGKWWERRFFAAADGVVSLTAAGVRAIPELGVRMRPGATIEVIPTCADLERFSPAPRDAALAESLGISGGPVVGCIGTMQNWYMRREMIEALAVLIRARPRLRVLVVTRDDHAALREDFARAGVPADRLVLTSARFEQMPHYMRLMDAALFFITPTFSKRGSAATKLAECLGCGVPVIINDGVGDSGTIVRDARAGVVLASLDADALAALPARVDALIADPGVAARCRAAAEASFDLGSGVGRYRKLYRGLLGGRGD